MRRALWAVAALGCSGDGTSPADAPLTETGWFAEETDDPTPTACEDRFVTTVPEDGAQGWYWRDRPQVFTQTAAHEAYSAVLEDARGLRLDTRLVWDQGAGQSATVEWDGSLAPSTDYVLRLTDCETTQEVRFRTSGLGAPLDVPAQDLQGNTYLLDLAGASWVEPAALAGIIQVYFTTPILVGVQYADASRIDLLGAPGLLDPLGRVSQDLSSTTWDFPIADFSDSPWLDVQAEAIVLSYSEGGVQAEIPVQDFVLQGTFEPDGSAIRQGVLLGLGDTREVGALLGDDRPEAMCELAAALGVTCRPCPGDGGPYCLDVRAEQVDGELVDGLRLVERG